MLKYKNHLRSMHIHIFFNFIYLK